jgi:nicotinate-nucleotide adenylyltransferase
MELAIFPGTFNPIHIAHLILAETTRQQFDLDKILFIPSNIPPHRNDNIASARDRYNMVKLACEDHEKFEVSDIEIMRFGPSYTYETVREVKKIYNERNQLYLIIGADALNQLHTWNFARELADNVIFLVLNRPGNPPIDTCVLNTMLTNITYQEIKAPLLEISSTYVRDKISKRKSIKFLVTDKVKDYIENHGLYRK